MNIFDSKEKDNFLVDIIGNALFCEKENEKDVVLLIHSLIVALSMKRNISRNDAFSLISQLWYKNNEKIIIDMEET